MAHPLIVPLHVSGRAKPNSFMYFRMCAQSLVIYRHFAEQLNALDHLDPRYDQMLTSVEEAAVEPVIYAGMCLEATLFDLAVCLFGDEFVEHTEKLDTLAKFYVIALFVDRRSPSKANVTYQTIQTVVTARNKLVHYKSQPGINVSNIGKIMDRAKKLHDQQMHGIAASFRSLVLLSLYFDGSIFEELRIIPSFKKQAYWIDIVPNELHEDVKSCIKLSQQERRQYKKK